MNENKISFVKRNLVMCTETKNPLALGLRNTQFTHLWKSSDGHRGCSALARVKETGTNVFRERTPSKSNQDELVVEFWPFIKLPDSTDLTS